MNYQQRFEEALRLYEEKKFYEASDIFEEVAEATLDVAAINNTIMLKTMLAKADDAMVSQGLGVSEDAFESVNSALKWIELAKNNDVLDPSMEGNYKTCCAIKGKLLYVVQNLECEDWLKNAIEAGDNQSRTLLTMYYKDVWEAIVDEGDEDKIDLISEYYVKMVHTAEDYIANYNPNEAESDELKLLSSWCALAYRDGVGVSADSVKARKYQQIADTFNEATKMANFDDPKPEKKKHGWFGL